MTCLARPGPVEAGAIPLPSGADGCFLPIYSMTDCQTFSGPSYKWIDFCLPLSEGRESQSCCSLRPASVRRDWRGLARTLWRLPLRPARSSWLLEPRASAHAALFLHALVLVPCSLCFCRPLRAGAILKVLSADFFCVVPWSARVVSFLPHTGRDSLSLAMHALCGPGPLPPSAAGSPGFWSAWMALWAVLGLGTWLPDGRN